MTYVSLEAIAPVSRLPSIKLSNYGEIESATIIGGLAIPLGIGARGNREKAFGCDQKTCKARKWKASMPLAMQACDSKRTKRASVCFGVHFPA
jgi:hypothetical protein